MIRTAVIGVGYLGQYHAEKVAQSNQAELVAVCDTHIDRAREIAMRLGTHATQDFHELLDQVDAVSIATPTPSHFAVARAFLEKGVHTLIEKPVTTSIAEADILIALAQQTGAILQVGHLERFNNAVTAIEPLISAPRFIESTRLSPFKMRGSDVNVILDLMIHDIDLINSLVKADIKQIQATGASVLSQFIDIANARIEFTNGCVANVTASRVSLRTERKLRIFEHDNYLSADLGHKKITAHQKGSGEMFPGIPNITRTSTRIDQGDALQKQIEAFFSSIVQNKPAIVTGMDGKKALATAIRITELVNQHNEQHPISNEKLSAIE